jgi:hypothetical protein
MINKNLFFAFVGMGVLTACTPADVNYCRGLGVNEQNSEYPACIQHYHQQEAWFGGDYSSCAMEADATYPPTLYDTWHTGWVHSYDPYYGIPRLQQVDIPPDVQHNAQIDALRSRIIHPCMNELGWNSPYSWQAGRHAPVKKSRRASPPAAPLPWLR